MLTFFSAVLAIGNSHMPTRSVLLVIEAKREKKDDPHHVFSAPLNICLSARQTRDPQLLLSLDNYPHVFSVTSTGIRRYLTLVQPLDRETQDSFIFTVLRAVVICVQYLCVREREIKKWIDKAAAGVLKN